MTRYQLAKLVEWAGMLRTRKRLQKVVFMLQAAGCPFEADYILHHYGPYSQELARLSDDMVQNGLLEESAEGNLVGRQYSYSLTEHAKQRISELEATAGGNQMAVQLVAFEDKAKQLLSADLWELEVASTVVYFRQQGNDWSEAVERTCKFKGLEPSNNGRFIKKVEELARQFVA